LFRGGWAVVGTTEREGVAAGNLFLINPDNRKPVWIRAANKDVEKAPARLAACPSATHAGQGPSCRWTLPEKSELN
jgi:hypothetical protein